MDRNFYHNTKHYYKITGNSNWLTTRNIWKCFLLNQSISYVRFKFTSSCYRIFLCRLNKYGKKATGVCRSNNLLPVFVSYELLKSVLKEEQDISVNNSLLIYVYKKNFLVYKRPLLYIKDLLKTRSNVIGSNLF